MTDLFENPMGLDGFEFVEFASPKPGVLEPVFHSLGFEAVARHRSKNVTLYRQGGINFILNEEPKSLAYYFAQEHGPCAAGMAFRVKDAHLAYNRALELGAQFGCRMHLGKREIQAVIDQFDHGCTPFSTSRRPGLLERSVGPRGLVAA